MKERANLHNATEIDQELLSLIKGQLEIIAKKEPLKGIILIPSRTWKGRDSLAEILGSHLQIPVLDQLLQWHEFPSKRQGELLNNDQRRDNVRGKMVAKKDKFFKGMGTILLLDDYIGSGSTIQESSRALRAVGIDNKLIPFTIASLKWHLGKPGFV
jgi:ATP-dependent DNA helicase RecQ